MGRKHPALDDVWAGEERRSGIDRRVDDERRSGQDRRSGRGFRPAPDRRVGVPLGWHFDPWGNFDRRQRPGRRADAA